MFSSTLVLFLDFVVHLNRNLYLRSVTGMPPCLRGAVLEPETHFSFLKINLLPPHPSFQAGSINKGGRNNAHSLNCWKRPSLFSTTIMTELHSCDSPPLFESSVSEADSLTNVFSSHTSFGGVLFRKLNIEMIY